MSEEKEKFKKYRNKINDSLKLIKCPKILWQGRNWHYDYIYILKRIATEHSFNLASLRKTLTNT